METPIANFFNNVHNFKQNLEKILATLNKYDELKKMNQHYEKMLFLKSVNSKMIIELFYEHVVIKYAYQILKKDENFFISKLNSVEVTDEDDLIMINTIKTIWNNLDKVIKDNIWQYIQVISFLAEKVTGKTELMDTKNKIY